MHRHQLLGKLKNHYVIINRWLFTNICFNIVSCQVNLVDTLYKTITRSYKNQYKNLPSYHSDLPLTLIEWEQKNQGQVRAGSDSRCLLPATYRPLVPSWDSKRARQRTWGWMWRRNCILRAAWPGIWRARTQAARCRRWLGALAGTAWWASCPVSCPAELQPAPIASWSRRRQATPLV